MAQLMTRSLLALFLLLGTQTSLASEQSARWLSNTFRIDPSITAITLLIEREQDSGPVVLIRPDGSKYYQQQHPKNISWASTGRRDVITLWQPEPGPWQATGKINKERGISLVSEFELAVTPLAERLYQQEVLKLNAELRHNSTRLDANYYLQDLALQAQLIDLKNDQQAQFAPAPLVIGHFLDDGQGLDAHPADGKLTAETIIDTLPGEYLFQAQISNQVLARTQEQNVLIYPMPLTVRFSTPDEQGQWHMELTADHELVADSLVVVGELLTPSQQQLPISGSGLRINLPDAVDSGNYYWQGRAFATNKQGREIQLNLAKQVIRVSPPVSKAADAVPEEESLPWTLMAAGGVLLLMLLIIGWIWRKRVINKRKNSQLP